MSYVKQRCAGRLQVGSCVALRQLRPLQSGRRSVALTRQTYGGFYLLQCLVWLPVGCPTKVQLIQRKENQQWYINFPAAIAHGMDFAKGEDVERTIAEKG